MTHQPDTAHTKTVSLALAYCLLFAPFAGCSNEREAPSPAAASDGAIEAVASVEVGDAATAPGTLDQAWEFVTATTASGLTIVSDNVSVGTDMVADASQTAWIWSADTTADGWGWIVENTGDATEWASDGLSNTWTITKQTSGEFSLWVQVKAENGVAWARTELPATWRVVKDSAGDAWIWIDEHKVEVAIAAAVVTVVVAALLVSPEGVAAAVAKGAAGGASSEGAKFLAETWNDRDKTEHSKTLKDASKDLFLSLGRSVIAQCGGQIASSLPVPGA